jgi:hypothetical protein
LRGDNFTAGAVATGVTDNISKRNGNCPGGSVEAGITDDGTPRNGDFAGVVVAATLPAATLPAATAAAVASAAVSRTGAGQGAGQKQQQLKNPPVPAGHDAKALVCAATQRETSKKAASGDKAAPAPAPPPAPVPPPGQAQQGKQSKKQKAATNTAETRQAGPAGSAGPVGSSGAAGMAPQEGPIDEFQLGLILFTSFLHQPSAQPQAAAKSDAAPQSPPPPAAVAKPAKGNKCKGQSTAAGAATAVALDEEPQKAGGKDGKKLEEADGKDGKKLEEEGSCLGLQWCPLMSLIPGYPHLGGRDARCELERVTWRIPELDTGAAPDPSFIRPKYKLDRGKGTVTLYESHSLALVRV